MYDKGTYGINWKDLIIKIVLLVLFLLLLWWIIPNPDLNTFYDKIFNQNLQSMKDAAKSYYTVDRLPAEIGESEKMTLSEMLSNKMVIPFVDKDNNECKADSSYVQVTRKGTQEYELKVYLDCETQTDYILETIGCYDVCVGDECDDIVTDIPEKALRTEYQFKRSSTINKNYYTCPTGWTLSGTNCYRGKTTSTKKNAKAVYTEGSTVYSDPKVTTETTKTGVGRIEKSSYSYVCPTGCNPIEDGSKCSVSGSKSITLSPAGTESYNCTWKYVETVRYRGAAPANTATVMYKYISTQTVGGVLYNIYEQYCLQCSYRYYFICNGVKQYHATCSTSTTEVRACTKVTSTTYSCPQGDDIVGEGSGSNLKCYKITKKQSLTCTDPNAKYDKDKNKCVKTTERKFKEWVCEDGWKLTGDKYCVKYSTGKDQQKATKKTSSKTNTVYKWSTSKTLSGWEFTGKTRTLYEVSLTSKKYKYN